jgi:hypothetical protein
MAKQVFDSPDLIRLIYSFGTPEHRKFTQTLKTDLEPDSTKLGVLFSKHSDIYPDMYSYLYKHSIRDLEEHLIRYKRCFCCTRHTHNKPIFSNGFIVITGTSVFEHPVSICDCPCRSLSRQIIKNLEKRK